MTTTHNHVLSRPPPGSRLRQPYISTDAPSSQPLPVPQRSSVPTISGPVPRDFQISWPLSASCGILQDCKQMTTLHGESHQFKRGQSKAGTGGACCQKRCSWLTRSSTSGSDALPPVVLQMCKQQTPATHGMFPPSAAGSF